MQLGLREQDIISIIVGSIGDINISVAAEAGNFRYCDDLASFLHGKLFIPSEGIQKNLNYKTAQSFDTRPSGHNNSNKDRKVEVPPPGGNVSNSNGNISCFRCGETNHKRNNCTVKDSVRCSLCNKLGHLEAACRSKPKTEKEKDFQL